MAMQLTPEQQEKLDDIIEHYEKYKPKKVEIKYNNDWVMSITFDGLRVFIYHVSAISFVVLKNKIFSEIKKRGVVNE